MTHGVPATVTVTPLRGIPEVEEGDDLADILDAGLAATGVSLADGDVLVVSSKIASKSRGLVTHDPDKDRVIAHETEYVVAERALEDRVARVVRAKAGPVMAAAGVDGSNTGARRGWLLLPHDPDAVCRELHDSLTERHGVRLAVVLSDTAGRPWRVGQVDFALGAYGLRVLDDLRGSHDLDGKPLEVTARAVADEIAAAADLVKGKVRAVPVAVVRGLGDLVPEDPGAGLPGARDLVRTGPQDWFGHGRVEAVRAALGIEPGSADAEEVGIPRQRPETRTERVSRAVSVAVHGMEGASADVGPTRVTLGAETAYDLGMLASRLEAALWCEWLSAAVEPPAPGGLTVSVGIHDRLGLASPSRRARQG
jgi:coenzyme F420-0:L-glutamate ligase/coenzyme F420-1:gamma-L-glutamate ligase